MRCASPHSSKVQGTYLHGRGGPRSGLPRSQSLSCHLDTHWPGPDVVPHRSRSPRWASERASHVAGHSLSPRQRDAPRARRDRRGRPALLSRPHPCCCSQAKCFLCMNGGRLSVFPAHSRAKLPGYPLLFLPDAGIPCIMHRPLIPLFSRLCVRREGERDPITAHEGTTAAPSNEPVRSQGRRLTGSGTRRGSAAIETPPLTGEVIPCGGHGECCLPAWWHGARGGSWSQFARIQHWSRRPPTELAFVIPSGCAAVQPTPALASLDET